MLILIHFREHGYNCQYMVLVLVVRTQMVRLSEVKLFFGALIEISNSKSNPVHCFLFCFDFIKEVLEPGDGNFLVKIVSEWLAAIT